MVNEMIQKLLDEIKTAIPTLPALQKKVGIFICEHPQMLGLLSLSEFAERIGVSRPTVSRFCRSLGYKGFLEFSRSVQRVIEDDISHAGFFRHAYAQNAGAAAGIAAGNGQCGFHSNNFLCIKMRKCPQGDISAC